MDRDGIAAVEGLQSSPEDVILVFLVLVGDAAKLEVLVGVWADQDLDLLSETVFLDLEESVDSFGRELAVMY